MADNHNAGVSKYLLLQRMDLEFIHLKFCPLQLKQVSEIGFRRISKISLLWWQSIYS